MSIFSRIVKWNSERLLIKSPEEANVERESAFIVEELLEMNSDLMSDEANKKALKIVEKEICIEWYKPSNDQVIDAAWDIIVFATGLISKFWYDPDLVMEEVLKEIESRKWKVIWWKFTKDKSDEAKKLWYKADFSKAKIR